MTIEEAVREYIRLYEIWQQKKKAHADLLKETDERCDQFKPDGEGVVRCFRNRDIDGEYVWGIGHMAGWCDACRETWDSRQAVCDASRKKGRAHANMTRLCATQPRLKI